jgi:hypothetical protein
MRKSLALAVIAFALFGVVAQAQTLAGPSLIARLKQGGYVLLMRHAASPFAIPEKAAAEPDNLKPERQLDDTGKATARAMGLALKSLGIAVGRVESSPTYRALQTARLAGLPKPETFPELGDGGMNMMGPGAPMPAAPAPSPGQGVWLRGKVAEPPAPGTNTIIFTHLPNIRAAYPDLANPADGEAMVFQTDGQGGAQLVGRIKIEAWPALAEAKP